MKIAAAFLALILGAAAVCAGNARAGEDVDVNKLLDSVPQAAPDKRPEAKVAFPAIVD